MGEGGGGFSPSALSLFRFHLSSFPPETPDTQATPDPPLDIQLSWSKGFSRARGRRSCSLAIK